jgi:hypothetical protein
MMPRRLSNRLNLEGSGAGMIGLLVLSGFRLNVNDLHGFHMTAFSLFPKNWREGLKLPGADIVGKAGRGQFIFRRRVTVKLCASNWYSAGGLPLSSRALVVRAMPWPKRLV